MKPPPTLRFAGLPSTAFFMAAIAGFTDVIGFVGVNKLFTAHITGNIVIAISELLHHSPGIAAQIISLPFFILIVALLTWMIEKHGQTKRLLAAFLAVEALLLTAFLFAGVYVIPFRELNSLPYIGGGMLGVAAMAIHNTLLRTFMTSFPPCTVMTGNLTQFVVDCVSYYKRKSLPYAVETPFFSHAGIQRIGNVLLGFLVGGGIAAFGFGWIGFWILGCGVALLGFMAVQAMKLD